MPIDLLIVEADRSPQNLADSELYNNTSPKEENVDCALFPI